MHRVCFLCPESWFEEEEEEEEEESSRINKGVYHFYQCLPLFDSTFFFIFSFFIAQPQTTTHNNNIEHTTTHTQKKAISSSLKDIKTQKGEATRTRTTTTMNADIASRVRF